MEHIMEEAAVIGFSKELFEKERAKETIERYQQQLRMFAQWVGERAVTKEITVCYKQWLMERYSPASVNVGLAVLNGFLTLWAGRSAGCVQFGCSADIMRNRAENCPGSNITGFCMLPAGKGDLRLFHLLETI